MSMRDYPSDTSADQVISTAPLKLYAVGHLDTWVASARSIVRLVLVASLAQTGSACSEGEGPTASPEVPIFEASIDLEIGEIDGDDPYLFTRIESIVEDASGRLIVADLQSHEVRVFGPEGDFLFHFGGQGEGPGELRYPCCLAFGPDSELWVRESTRYSAFRLEAASAEYASGLRIAHSGVGMVSPVSFDAEGRLVDIGPVNGPGGHAPGGAWAEAITSAYSINYHHPDGTVFRIEGPPLLGPALSPDERGRAQAYIDRDLQRFDLQSHPFAIPDRKPVLADIFFDRSDRLWVEKTGADGDQMRQADVYMGAALVARYRWPRRVRPGNVPWASESLLYGTTRDSLDVQRVARVRFRPLP